MSQRIAFALEITNAADFRHGLSVAQRIRFDGVTTSAAALRPGELSHTGRREIRALLARHELRGTALRADVPGKGLAVGADADRFLADLHEAAVLARDCAFTLIACDLGRLPRTVAVPPPRPPIDPLRAGLIVIPEPANIEPPQPLTDEERRHAALVTDVLREAGQRIDRVGVPVAFSASLAAMADLAACLAAVACPVFGRELDPVAVLAEGAEPPACVGLEPPVLHVRGRDAFRGAAGRTRPAPLGEGDVSWPELLAALRDADFGGAVTLEVRASQAGDVLARLRV